MQVLLSLLILVITAGLGDCQSSPGWLNQPQDVAILEGGSITFYCRNSIAHTVIRWLKDGKTVTSASTSKLRISQDRRSASYGPVAVEDDDVSIGCEVDTVHYGTLPSQMGKIKVYSIPSYDPPLIQFASLGKPFQLDFNYTASLPPTVYTWYKNAEIFEGDGTRVTLSYRGVTFTRVLATDAGTYSIMAGGGGVVARVASTLKVIFYEKNGYSQTGSLHSPIPTKDLALVIALEGDNSTLDSLPISKDEILVSEHARHIINLYLKFKSPIPASKENGDARLKEEKVITFFSKLLGRDSRDISLTDKEMEMIEEHVKCLSNRVKPNCTLRDFQYRRIDGTCNNFFYPLNGASGTSLARLLPANYEDGISTPVGLAQQLAGRPFDSPWPSPRVVSAGIVKDITSTPLENPTQMFMQWGQFLDHDLDISPVFPEDECKCDVTPKCFPILVQPQDPAFGTGTTNNGECLIFSRSVPVCSRDPNKSMARNQVNDLTSYIDASNVYGSTQELANRLRLFKAGMLKQGGRLDSFKGNLPFEEETSDFGPLPFFAAGDSRVNEQLGLTIMHTIWLREHNRIARRLSAINPCWNDRKLYQETRKIVGAMHQVITFKEFLPTLFGTRHFSTYISRFRGYNPHIDASIPASFSTAAYRFGHSMVKDQLDRLDRDFRRLSIGPLPLEKAFFNPIRYFESFGTDPILRGLAVTNVNSVDEFLNSVLTTKLFMEEGKDFGMDLASLNIQRGRDHGLPSYREFEKFCKRLFPSVPVSFERQDTEGKLRQIYGDKGFREGIDLWVGGLAEKKISGGLVGPTFACIIGTTFSRLRDGDRFWFRNPGVFSSGQRFELLKTSLAKVVCTNGDDIPAVPSNIFSHSSFKTDCSLLPTVNLLRWRDQRCRRPSNRG